MTDKNKKMAIGGVLAGGLIVSIILWSTVKPFGGEVDKSLDARKQKYTCAKCGNKYEYSVAEATKIRYAHEGLIPCPKCGSTDTIKEGVKIQVSGGQPSKPVGFGKDEESTGDHTAQDAPPTKASATGGRKRGGD